MKDLKYYKEIFCSSELELYFMEENGSCSFNKENYAKLKSSGFRLEF